MMNANTNIKGKTIKLFSFTLENGQNIELNQKEAEYIRDYLSIELPKSREIKVMTYKEYAPILSEKIESESKSRSIPDGYYEIFRSKSDPRNGKEPYTYVYYRDPLGNLGFQVENGHVYQFVKVGKIEDKNSSIGKLLRAIPPYEGVTRDWFKRNRIQTNNQIIKAETDILEHFGYIVKDVDIFDYRNARKYTTTSKVTELEVENNHEELKVPKVSSSQ
jgi:hypothetical protein